MKLTGIVNSDSKQQVNANALYMQHAPKFGVDLASYAIRMSVGQLLRDSVKYC